MVKENVERVYFGATEIAQELGVDTATLYHWEKIFKIHPARVSGRKLRRYSLKQRQTLYAIHNLRKVEQYTIEGTKRRMKELKKQGLIK